jgi:hypothetical protein
MFRFLRSFHIVFQNGCTSLHSHQQCMRVLFSPQPHQRLLVVVFLMIAILTGVRWNISVVLICISFMARDGENFFVCFCPFGLLPSKKFCLVGFPASLLVHWFWRSIVFWAPCVFWLSVLWCIASKYFLRLYGWSLQFRDHFFLLCRSFLILYNPICPSFLLVAGLLEFYWGSSCLYLLLPVYSLFLPVLTSDFWVWY